MNYTLRLAVLVYIAALCHANVSGSDSDCAGRADGWIQEIGCWGYTDCVGGKAVRHPCPPDTVYDRDAKKCVLPGSSNSTDCGAAAGCSGRANGYYADSTCNSYIYCLNGNNLGRQYCPYNLVFNEPFGYCDWSYNVPAPCGTKTNDS